MRARPGPSARRRFGALLLGAAALLGAARPAAAGDPECWIGVILPGRSVEVVAEVPGRVVAVAVRPGDRVAAGQLLATLDAAPVRRQLDGERAALAAAGIEQRRLEAELEQAQRELARMRRLDGLVAERDLDAAVFRVATARAQAELAGAERERVEAGVGRLADELGRAELRAPFDGRIALRHVDPGAVVAEGAPVLRLLGGEETFVRFAVPPERVGGAGGLAPGDPVTVETVGGGEPGRPASPVRATIRQVAPEVDAAAGLVFVEARLAVPSATAPGAAARVSPGAAPAIPTCSEDARTLR